jgi:hypothetical protein
MSYGSLHIAGSCAPSLLYRQSREKTKREKVRSHYLISLQVRSLANSIIRKKKKKAHFIKIQLASHSYSKPFLSIKTMQGLKNKFWPFHSSYF